MACNYCTSETCEGGYYSKHDWEGMYSDPKPHSKRCMCVRCLGDMMRGTRYDPAVASSEDRLRQDAEAKWSQRKEAEGDMTQVRDEQYVARRDQFNSGFFFGLVIGACAMACACVFALWAYTA